MWNGETTVPLVLTRDDREILTGNRLKVVVAQAKFPPIHALNSPQGVAGFQEVIRDRYPISEERSRQVTLRMSSAGVESDAAQPGPWRFLTEDGAWIVALSADSLSLETTSYRAYEDFRRRAAELFLLVAEVIRPARLERFGMRFLNELALPGVSTLADWRPYLGEDLLGLGPGAERFQERLEGLPNDRCREASRRVVAAGSFALRAGL